MGPSVAGDARIRRWSARWERLGASPGAALRILQMLARMDVRPWVPRVHVPTLVLHRTGDRAVPVESGRYLARKIPGAKLVELAGDDHIPMTGDAGALLDAICDFIKQVR